MSVEPAASLASAEPLPAPVAGPASASTYHRYHISAAPATDVVRMPSRFLVRVKKHRLAALLVKELFHYRFNLPVVMSRPCVYGVFSGPVGGFAPRPQLCVGCLRCTTQYPEVVQIHRNPKRLRLGDSYFTSEFVDTVTYEAEGGRVPVRGAGYRGKFGGTGWDAMWTDMSEIVRPTRDGIHGREFISTSVDIGEKPPYLELGPNGRPRNGPERVFSLPLPFLLDAPPNVASDLLHDVLVRTAVETQTLAILPVGAIARPGRRPDPADLPHVVPLVAPEDRGFLEAIPGRPRMVELARWHEALHADVRNRFPEALVAVRIAFEPGYLDRIDRAFAAGVRVFHLVADLHGRGADGRFVGDLVREAHGHFVRRALRDEVTLLGSGGIVAAEHVPKSIICGLDAVALDTSLLVALQGDFVGECRDRATSRFALPTFTPEWGVQRLKNLFNSWRDQLLEILGAMGLREVRRLRGEMGRCMFQSEIEKEAFGEIAGYVERA